MAHTMVLCCIPSAIAPPIGLSKGGCPVFQITQDEVFKVEINNNVEQMKSQDENLMNPRIFPDYPGGNRFALSHTHRFISPQLL